MVIYVVARNPFMRTARNVFIVNLAISDLMLCLITMPLTLVEILYVTWQFGEFGEVRQIINERYLDKYRVTHQVVPVDIITKVAFQYMLLKLKRNSFDVNRRLGLGTT